MVREVSRRTSASIARKASQFLFLRNEEKVIRTRKEQERDAIKQWMQNNAETDHEGHQYFYLPETVNIGGEKFNKLKNERKVSRYISEEKLIELAEEKGVRDRVVKVIEIEVVDQDELYVLNQEGIISDEELDNVFEEDVKFALVPVKE
jgi:hypothetical protein